MCLYNKRGVSAQKEAVHAAVKNLDQGLFPNAFCKVYPDFLGGDDAFVIVNNFFDYRKSYPCAGIFVPFV